MADEADKTFKWTCEKCGARFEETDFGMLEVRRQKHKCGKISFMVWGKAREGEPRPKARRISFISHR